MGQGHGILETMKRWMIGFFLCYPLLPLGLFAGISLFQGSPLAILIAPYYALLLASLFHLARLPRLPGLFYKGALLAVFVHLSALAVQIGAPLLGQMREPKYALEVLLLAILGVYVLASWAGAALAASRGKHVAVALQLLAPVVSVFASQSDLGDWGSFLVILSFGSQGLQALFLGLAGVEPAQAEKPEPGFTPVESM